MKKLHAFAFYALVTPVLTLGAGSVLAQQSADEGMDTEQQKIHADKEVKRPAPGTAQSDQSSRDSWQSESKKAEKAQHMQDKGHMKHLGYLDSAPADGLQASNLIGTGVRTTNGDDDVGSVSDLIIDEKGQVVAIVVGVGGFLGMGDRDVAIGWDEVTKTHGDDGLELRINKTRDDLSSAPAFESQADD